MNKPKLIMMVGLSASGKSTIAKELAVIEDAAIVSSDEIRGEICPGGVQDQSMNEMVFLEFRKRIVDILKSDRSVIADATNITIKRRAATLAVVRDIDCEKIAYIVPKTIADCVIDDKAREYSVGEAVITRQRASFQVPFKEEGFDKIIIHRFEKEKSYDAMGAALKHMRVFDQKNPHHKGTLLRHSCDVVDRFIYSGEPVGNRALLYFGSLHHDVGKLFTQTFDDEGVAHYYNHANVGAYWFISQAYLEFDPDYSDVFLDNTFLINYHMLPFDWNTDKAREKWLGVFGKEKFDALMVLHKCDVGREKKPVEKEIKSSADTYDSDIDLEDIAWQTERHMKQLREEISREA